MKLIDKYLAEMEANKKRLKAIKSTKGVIF